MAFSKVGNKDRGSPREPELGTTGLLFCAADASERDTAAAAAGVAESVMARLEDGSVVWARSHPKEKFWPSVIFHTWEAAKEAGFVLDGIAFLIEAGRKIDVTDDEAAPREGEVLNL